MLYKSNREYKNICVKNLVRARTCEGHIISDDLENKIFFINKNLF